jgi:hypothetical protein
MLLINNCRVCGKKFNSKSTLYLRNIPGDAQSFSVALPQKKYLKDLALMECSGCGLSQLRTPPVSYYKDVVRANAFSKDMQSFRKRQLIKWKRNYLNQTSKVLEIGAGKGEYIKLLNDIQINAFGIENSITNIRLSSISQKIQRGYLQAEAPLLKHGPFDAFISFNFLEHWPDPGSVFTGLRKNLNKTAFGLIEVPNFEMMVQKKMYSEFIPDHLFYFTKDTLKRTLELNGFDVIKISTIWHNYILSAEVELRKTIDLSHFQVHQKYLKDQLYQFIKSHDKHPIVVWGAGHQALTTISMSQISKRIAYIVDSAPFKQGKYAPGCNLLVYSPLQLEKDQIQSLIIMGAGYSDEILKLVRKKYNHILNIAVLKEDHLEIIHG